MKKSLSVLVVLSVVAALSTAAVAQQDSTIWFDIRDNSAGVQDITGTPSIPFTNGQEDGVPATNLGARGDGQVLRINPDCTNDFEIDSVAGPTTRYPDFDADGDVKTGSLWLYMDVGGPFGTNDVISSIGLDMDIELLGGGVPASGQLFSISYAWTGTGFSDANAGVANGASTATNPPDWEDAKAVKVPVVAGPLYAVGTGLTPGGPYQIGQLNVVAGARGAMGATYAADSTYELHLVVDSLLITRVFEAGGDTQEDVSFGYAAGLPETPAVNGSSAGASSTAADAIIKVRMKGDSNGDGATDGNDIGAGPNAFKNVFNQTSGTLEQEKTYLHDFDHSLAVDGSDIFGFKQAIALANAGGC